MGRLKKSILFCLLPILLATPTETNRHFYSTRDEPRTSIKFEFDHSGRDYTLGVAIQTENRTTIYGFSSSRGFETFSYQIDKQGRVIADSDLEF